MGQVTWEFSGENAPPDRRRMNDGRRLCDRSADLTKNRQQGSVDVRHEESNEDIAGEATYETNRQSITALCAREETVVESQRSQRELDTDPAKAQKIRAKPDAAR